jgi:hypothetical protein
MEKGFKGIRNVNGRPKGALNKTTAETKELIRSIVSNQLDEVEALLNQMEAKERFDAIIKLLPYIVPRQNEITVEAKEELFKTLTITLIDANDANNNR